MGNEQKNNSNTKTESLSKNKIQKIERSFHNEILKETYTYLSSQLEKYKNINITVVEPKKAS